MARARRARYGVGGGREARGSVVGHRGSAVGGARAAGDVPPATHGVGAGRSRRIGASAGLRLGARGPHAARTPEHPHPTRRRKER